MKLKAIFILLCFVLIMNSCDEKKLETVDIFIKDEKFKVELARTEDEQKLGLMFRKNIGKREGMLFVYNKLVTNGFWMKNVRLPLSIAFIGPKGNIIDIKKMKPFSEEPIYSSLPYQYALEVKRGVFDELAIEAGDYIKLPVILH